MGYILYVSDVRKSGLEVIFGPVFIVSWSIFPNFMVLFYEKSITKQVLFCSFSNKVIKTTKQGLFYDFARKVHQSRYYFMILRERYIKTGTIL